jgi:hypothetical protein
MALAALAGCDISASLGLERHVPDETQVVVRPPLTLPPDYDLLPPGGTTPVSGDHEGAQSQADAGLAPVPPKKEERGFFGRIFHGDIFDSGDDTPTPPAPLPDANQPDGAQAPPKSSSISPVGRSLLAGDVAGPFAVSVGFVGVV